MADTVNASIPLQAQGPAPITLNSIAQMMQMQQQVKQAKQQQQIQNSLAAIYANPANLGPDGLPNAQAIQSIGRISPQVAQQMTTQRATVDEKMALTSQHQMEAGQSAQKNIQSMVRDPALNAYDEALASGKSPQQAQQIAQGIYSDGLGSLFGGGYVPDAMKEQVPKNFDAVRVRANSLSYKDQQNLNQKQSTQADTQDYRKAELGIRQEDVGIANARLGIEEHREGRESGKDASGGAGGLSPDAIKDAAARYNLDGTLPPMGMGKAGMELRTQILNQAAGMASGVDATKQRESQLESKAAASARSGLEKTANNIQLAEKTALGSADMVENASKNYDRSSSPLANRSINAFRSNIMGDPKYQKLQNDVTTFKNEYVKVMSGAGQATDSSRAEADHLVNTDMSHEQLMAGMSEMKKEMQQVREQAIQATRADSSQQINKGSGSDKTLTYDPATGTFK